MKSCTDCLSNFGIVVPARFSAPIGSKNGFTYVAVCSNHANGWYDGADFDQAEAPIYPIQGE